MSKVNIGDRIRVVNPVMAWGVYDEGDIFEIKRVGDEESVYVREHDHVILKEEYEVIGKPWKKGDKVRNKRTGKVVEVYAYQPTHRTVGVRSVFASHEKGFTFIENGREEWSHIEDFELIEEKGSEDMAKENGCDTIKMTMPDGTVIEGTAESLAEMQKLSAEHVEEEVGVEDEKEEDKTSNHFNIGDKVRICVPEHEETKHSRAGVTNDEIGTVKAINGDKIEVKFLSYSDTSTWSGHPSELEVVEGDEIDLSFIRAGREPGEFVVGDIVEVTESRSGHYVGTIGEIVKVLSLGRGEVKAIKEGTYMEFREGNLKLIAPADKRVDIDA